MNTGTAQAKKKIIVVPIASLTIDTFVRQAVDPDYIVHLAALYEAGESLDPIVITKSNRVIDGRCRIQAAQLARLTELPAEVRDDMPKKEVLMNALTANLGGSRAPTKADIIGAIEAMMKAPASEKWIREQLPFPAAVTSVYLAEARNSIARQKLAEARRAMAERGLTAQQAANEFGLTVERINVAILGQKPKRARDDQFSDFIAGIKRRNKSVGQKNIWTFKSIMTSFKDGDLSKDEALQIFEEIERHGELSVTAARDFRKRFFQQASL